MSTTYMETTSEVETTWPEWFRQEQAGALADYEATPAPARTDELWRYSNIAAVSDLSAFQPAGPVESEGKLITASQGVPEFSAKLVFGNNTLLHQDTDRLPEGVILKSLDAAAQENADLFKKYFMAQPVELGSHKFAALHKARLAGAFLYVPKNIEVALPIEIFHWVEGENASVFPHTLIVCGENSKVTVIDNFKSADGKRAFACGVNDLHLERGAQLTYVAVQDWAKDSLAFHINSTIVGRDANSTALNMNFGGGFVRGEALSRLVGEGSKSVMLSLNPVDGTRQIDQRTLQDHAAPNSSSDLLYLNALDDTCRTTFAGLIKVEEGAHKTDAYQKVRNLLLSDGAEANSMPGLEILADDVRCTHGATAGEIDEEELFYFQARGIRKADGQRLIVNGFFQTLLERLESAKLREYLSALVNKRLGVAS